MNLLRIGLFLLLSLALPVNGMAHLLMSAEPCAMHGSHMPAETSHAMADHGSHAGHAMGHDVVEHVECADPAEHGDGSQPCKSGLDCKTGSLLQVGNIKTALPLLGQPGPFPLSFAPLPGQSEPLWHPPRA